MCLGYEKRQNMNKDIFLFLRKLPSGIDSKTCCVTPFQQAINVRSDIDKATMQQCFKTWISLSEKNIAMKIKRIITLNLDDVIFSLEPNLMHFIWGRWANSHFVFFFVLFFFTFICRGL